MGSLVLAGGRLSHDTAIYTLGLAAVFPLSLLSVAVVTRFLDPSAYGRLGVLFVFAGLLTTVYNLGTLHGTFMYVFGMGEADDSDGDVDGDVLTDTATDRPRASHESRALGTGLTLTVLMVTIGTTVVVLLAPTLAHLLVGSRNEAGLVRWAAVSAATGSIWRLNVNLFRMERRPLTFALMTASRPVFALVGTVGLLIAGLGLEGPLIGTAAGTTASVVVMLLLSRRSWALGFDIGDARQIVRFGARFIGVTVAMWTVHSADLLFLSDYASPHQVGLYRLASRFAMIPSYFVSAFLMAWSPLERTPLLQSAYDDGGTAQVKGLLFLYYYVIASVLVVVLGLVADLLVLIAAPSYGSAAPLIPVIGTGALAYGAFLVMARLARIRRKALVYNLVAIGACLVFCGLALILIPLFGAYGAALISIVPMALAAGIFLILIQRGPEPIAFPYRRVVGATALCGGVYSAALVGRHLPAGWHAAAETALLLALPALIWITGVLPRHHLRRLLLVCRTAIVGDTPTKVLLSRLRALRTPERAVLEALVRDRLDAKTFSKRSGIAIELVTARLVRGLRDVAHAGPARPQDSVVGQILLADITSIERDSRNATLIARGMIPLELHAIESTFRTLRRLPSRRWPTEQPSRPAWQRWPLAPK